MPAYNAARAEVKAQRLEASTALLADAGVTIKLEDPRRYHYRLKREGVKDLRLQNDGYVAKIIETTNWREATEEDYTAFLDGPTGKQERELLRLAATLVAHDLKNKAHEEQRGR
jgi:hypothetical protein